MPLALPFLLPEARSLLPPGFLRSRLKCEDLGQGDLLKCSQEKPVTDQEEGSGGGETWVQLGTKSLGARLWFDPAGPQAITYSLGLSCLKARELDGHSPALNSHWPWTAWGAAYCQGQVGSLPVQILMWNGLKQCRESTDFQPRIENTVFSLWFLTLWMWKLGIKSLTLYLLKKKSP